MAAQCRFAASLLRQQALRVHFSLLRERALILAKAKAQTT